MLRKKALISIIDDDESVRQATQGLIRSAGFAAECFASAEDFLASDCPARTACVIADVQMPGISGVDLYYQLVASDRHLPFILITAYPDDRVRLRVLAAGVAGYLVKPFHEDDLLRCVDACLEAGRKGP
jgi:FixJ family two-component response regulator